MPEPLTKQQLREIQDRVTATRKGDWDMHLDNDGQPAGFGPFSYVEPWLEDELLPAIDFCTHARADVPALIGEVARLQRELLIERGLRERAERRRTARPAPTATLHWAAQLDADDLEAFLSELATAASGDDDLTTLQTVEKTITEWRRNADEQQRLATPGGSRAR
ncbi:hypothetical protein ACIOWI_29455 [Streptomyces sp. NPDC087659]|uniref:hypothetical protein n=1 Tax=Streptomyces sp. NPDC087659 TaxID=3365801 RepID=UPI0038133D58